MAKILIADDAKIMRNILRLILEKQGHEVVAEAVSGEEALQLYQEFQPDLVTLDIHMEPIDGISCLRDIMQKDASARVLMVSAIGQQGKIDEAASLGARGYVTKPFQQNEIDQKVRQALA
jgi:two-component system chemotaxis response regulator CheY